MARARTVAALYVDPHGPYMHRPDVDPWTADRDATLYAGPWPVVAHPPCGAYSRHKYHHAQDDSHCGPRAVVQVRTFGGVLEHPIHSSLWGIVGLPRPGQGVDAFGGWTLTVEQGWWDHPAPKASWLYVVGLPLDGIPLPVEPRRVALGRVERLSKRRRRLTYPLFADFLIAVARATRVHP